jgi:ribosomal protein S27AE
MDFATESALRELRERDLLRAPCPGCGSHLTFQAESQLLACGHCGATQALPFSQQKLAERPLSALLTGEELPADRVSEQLLFCCPSCGSRTRVNADQPTLSCGFCGSLAINPEAQRTRLIEPAGVLPFRLGRPAATASFRTWLAGQWLAPNKLKSGAVLDNLHGIYLPFWTFDAQAYSEWRGERGDHYYVSVSSTDSQGRATTRQEQRTSWSTRSGTHQHFYDDLLLLASRSLTNQQQHVEAVLDDYDLDAVVDYDARVLLGWEAEVYGIGLAEGLQEARATFRQQEIESCKQELGGDEQRGLEVRTNLTDESFKHLLLPLWVCAYVYQGKLYHFLVNGQTGRVSGSHPYSPWKIGLLVLLGLLLAGALYYFINQHQSTASISPVYQP